MLGALAAIWSAVQRGRIESRNRRVEITLDYVELRDLAAAEGRPLREVLETFRAAGAGSLALAEDTIGGLEDARRIAVGLEPTGKTRYDTVLRLAAEDIGQTPLAARVADAVENKTRWGVTVVDASRPALFRTPERGALAISQPYAVLRTLGVGLDPEATREIRRAGLGIVGRVGNWPGVRPEGIRWTMEQLRAQGVSTVIFSGDETLGFKGHIADDPEEPGVDSTESVLRSLGLYYGAVEFVKQKGDAELAKVAQDRTVRVHTVSGAEMLAADIPSNVQRFLLAARERNIRLLFVRLFPDEPDALRKNAEYVKKIRDGLRRGYLTPGSAHGFGDLHASPILRLLMGVGLAAAWLLLLRSLMGPLTGKWGWLAALGGFFLAALAALPGTTGPKLAALAAACLYPTLALVERDLLRPVGKGISARGALEYVYRRLLRVTGITLLGAATIVGLLADRIFLIKADAFAGIKASQLVPLLIVALVYFFGLWASEERPWPRPLADAGGRVVTLAGRPILLWQAALALVVLVALALVVLRSGNDPGVAVSGLELRLRALLDRLLFVRPRFKEFVIGHPAMVVALGLAVTGRREWALPLFFVGALGTVSLLNTFCHLHTPLPVSLLRAFLGFVIGVAVGTAAFLLLDRMLRKLRV